MIRPATFVCALMAFGSGLYLYQSKHGAQLLDREIARTVHDTDLANDRIKVLTAEWQLLNEPERLQGLAQQYLPLRPMSPTQIVAMADLGTRLPAPLPASAFMPPATFDEPGTPPVAAPAPGSVVPPVAPLAVPAAPAPTAALVASAVPPRPAPRAVPPAAPPAFAPSPLVAASVVAAAAPLPPRPVAERAALERPALERATVERVADRGGDRALPEPPVAPRPLPHRAAPDVVPPTRPSAPVLIGPAVAAPLAPAMPLSTRPALVQRIAASVPQPAPIAPPAPIRVAAAPAPAAAPVQAPSPVAFPYAPPATVSALGMASRPLLPPPVPVH